MSENFMMKQLDKAVKKRNPSNKKATLPQKALTWGIVLAFGLGIAVCKEREQQLDHKEG